MIAAFYTLGCKLNQCESEALATAFGSRGFLIGSPSEDADVYVINTCTVTSKAEQKARRMIRKLADEHPASMIIVTGCYAQLDREDLKLAPNVIVTAHDAKARLNSLPAFIAENCTEGFMDSSLHNAVRRFFDAEKPDASEPERFWYRSVDFNYHTRAYLKIQDGCDNSCAYCRVVIARGKSVSLDSGAVVDQFCKLRDSGYREVVLTGVNLTSYRDSGGTDLPELLGILAAQAGGCRIRLSSLEPEAVDERLAEALAPEPICPHFHISVQSGSDGILSLMRRHNDSTQIRRATKLLRDVKGDPFYAADIIAGFPGETDDDFRLTYGLMEELEYAHLHVFPFSARPDTAAALMKPMVPQRVSGERTRLLRELSVKNYRKYLSRWRGKEIDVLIEDKNGGLCTGTSQNYIKAAVCDILEGEGRLCRARLDDSPAVACRVLPGYEPASFISWLD